MLAHLRAVGALQKVAGVIVGQFTDLKRGTDDGALGFDEVLTTYLAPLKVPVAYGFPIGHVDDQWTLPLGVNARLDATAGELEILDRAVQCRVATPALSRHRLPGYLGDVLVDVRTGDRATPRPAVLVLHGYKGFKDWGMFPPLAERLARAGLRPSAST